MPVRRAWRQIIGREKAKSTVFVRVQSFRRGVWQGRRGLMACSGLKDMC